MKPSLSACLPFCILPSAFDALRGHILAGPQVETDRMLAYYAQPKAETFDDYCHVEAEKKLGMRFDPATGIVVQPVIGTMIDGVDAFWEAFFDCFDTSRIVETAAYCAENAGVRGLVLYFDSPGGYSCGVEDANGALLALRAARPDIPVLAYVNGYCCSAAAWVAAGCQERHSARKGIVGSVGTYIITVDSSRYYAALGLEVRLFSDGKYKGMGAEGVAWPPEWYAWIEKAVAGVSVRIKGAVRSACPKVTDEWMQGQGFSAAELLESGETGDGHFLQSVPTLTGEGGFATFDTFLSEVAARL